MVSKSKKPFEISVNLIWRNGKILVTRIGKRRYRTTPKAFGSFSELAHELEEMCQRILTQRRRRTRTPRV